MEGEIKMKKVLIVGTGIRSSKVLLQLFAGLDDVISTNAQAFEGSTIKDDFTKISTKLSELGYDVLINNKKQAEFIPASRLSEVVSQRDGFKGQVEALNTQLETMKKDAANNPELQKQLQMQIDSNSKLMKDMEQTKINTEIMVAAKDAINSKDLLAFINMDNIKVNAKGEILGVESEITRLKTEKPYLFGAAGAGTGKKGGMDNGGAGNNNTGGMNAAIRRAAGR